MNPVDVAATTTSHDGSGESGLPDSPPKEPKPKESPASLSHTVEAHDGEEDSTMNVPRRSLFGPFPTLIKEDAPQRQSAAPIRPSQATSLPPTTVTDSAVSSQASSGESRPLTLDPDPQIRQPQIPVTASMLRSPKEVPPPPLEREKTAPAIGPATDKPSPISKEFEIEGPVLHITLLLSSTGARHPYRLDERYLRKRNVIVEDNNPINISLYKLKELILRDWREEWEVKPTSPESIRLISMGKMLNDKARLSDSGFTNGATPHIIHMTIKPQETLDEEDTKMKSHGKDREGNERSPGCRCMIQ